MLEVLEVHLYLVLQLVRRARPALLNSNTLLHEKRFLSKASFEQKLTEIRKPPVVRSAVRSSCDRIVTPSVSPPMPLSPSHQVKHF